MYLCCTNKDLSLIYILVGNNYNAALKNNHKATDNTTLAGINPGGNITTGGYSSVVKEPVGRAVVTASKVEAQQYIMAVTAGQDPHPVPEQSSCLVTSSST